MHAMQYEITLPADYDMRIVHRRVATRGGLTDDLPGLGLKAYLVRERDDPGTAGAGGGSPVNQYAPVYLWRTAEGMADFLTGPGFRGLCADFGRPAVRHWLGAGFRPGPAVDGTPRFATRARHALPEEADPDEAVAAAVDGLPGAPGLHSAAIALDPYRWELLHLALWRDVPPAAADGTRYRVLHLSRPELDRLPVHAKA
ncbi:DUF4865 family protein [Kitasatospora paranensis]|uniref:DUF4865 family protein n=1 Tax=Kitasatospora paranensis TaxID=258053 RepID=A0ABW2G5K1_9ACTN